MKILSPIFFKPKRMDLNKEFPSKESLLQYVSDVDVYRHYTGEDVELKRVRLSPLRKESNPSFAYYMVGDEIRFKDFVIGSGDFIQFVQILLGKTFNDAMNQIIVDLDLTEHFICRDVPKTVVKDYSPRDIKDRDDIIANNRKFRLGIKTRDWQHHDGDFWSSCGIGLKTLQKYNVSPISHVFYNDHIIKADEKAYVFKEYKDGKETYKIYQPYNEKYKWMNNHDYSVWQGWAQMPKEDNILIITKSLKDVMAIVQNTKFSAVSLQAENVLPKPHIINELEERFGLIMVLYDNDNESDINWGRLFGQRLADTYRLYQIEIPDEYGCKDFTDLILKIGRKEASLVLQNLIHNYTPF